MDHILLGLCMLFMDIKYLNGSRTDTSCYDKNVIRLITKNVFLYFLGQFFLKNEFLVMILTSSYT